MLSSQGTSIGEAIRLSKNYYDDDNQTNSNLTFLYRNHAGIWLDPIMGFYSNPRQSNND